MWRRGSAPAASSPAVGELAPGRLHGRHRPHEPSWRHSILAPVGCFRRLGRSSSFQRPGACPSPLGQQFVRCALSCTQRSEVHGPVSDPGHARCVHSREPARTRLYPRRFGPMPSALDLASTSFVVARPTPASPMAALLGDLPIQHFAILSGLRHVTTPLAATRPRKPQASRGEARIRPGWRPLDSGTYPCPRHVRIRSSASRCAHRVPAHPLGGPNTVSVRDRIVVARLPVLERCQSPQFQANRATSRRMTLLRPSSRTTTGPGVVRWHDLCHDSPSNQTAADSVQPPPFHVKRCTRAGPPAGPDGSGRRPRLANKRGPGRAARRC